MRNRLLTILMVFILAGASAGGAAAAVTGLDGQGQEARVMAAPADQGMTEGPVMQAYNCGFTIWYFADHGNRLIATGGVGCNPPATGTLVINFYNANGSWIGQSTTYMRNGTYKPLQASYWCPGYGYRGIYAVGYFVDSYGYRTASWGTNPIYSYC